MLLVGAEALRSRGSASCHGAGTSSQLIAAGRPRLAITLPMGAQLVSTDAPHSGHRNGRRRAIMRRTAW
jgi:hypothetical protein